MLRTHIFDEASIVKFCEATSDTNIIHDPAYMKAIGKEVVVPGMLILSSAIGMAQKLLDMGADTFHLNFHSIISANERIKIGYQIIREHPLLAEITARNSVDALSLKGEPSMVFQRSEIPGEAPEGIPRILPVNPESVRDFSMVTGLEKHPLGGILFAIAYASQALIRAILEPVSEVEKEIHRLLDKTINPDQVSPFYQSLRIWLLHPMAVLLDNEPLNYHIQFQTEKPRKMYSALVDCYQKNTRLYFSRYQLIAIPDRLIIRMAKDLDGSDKTT